MARIELGGGEAWWLDVLEPHTYGHSPGITNNVATRVENLLM